MILVDGYTELVEPQATGESRPVLQARPAMLASLEDTWWEVKEPGALTLRPQRVRDSADAAVAQAIRTVIDVDLVPALAALTTIDEVVKSLEHPNEDFARACRLNPLCVTKAAVLCALTGQLEERDSYLAIARERAPLGPANFTNHLDNLQARLLAFKGDS